MMKLHMAIRQSRAALSFLLVCMSCAGASAAETVERDLVIYGSSPAAISAAVQAKRMGRSVVVVSPETRIGGLTTGGLGKTDVSSKAAFGGIALEFYKAVGEYYGENADKWRFEPSAALSILEGWEKRDALDFDCADRDESEVRIDIIKRYVK